MSITAKDIAKELHISPAAVSMALNNKPGVSEETRTQVFEIANRKGFKFSKKMLKRNHKMIAFVFFKMNFVFDTPFFSELGKGIETTVKEKGYHLNVYHIHDGDDIHEEVSNILKDDPEGLILFGTLITREEVHHFNNLGIPTILLDAYFEEFDGDTVVINNMDGAQKATEYLIERCKACPGYISSSETFSNLEERANGFYNALHHHGYHSSRAIVHHVIPSIEGAHADMLDILNRNEPLASCYFCDNDEIAIGSMKAFEEKGFRIPEDISIIGFDNMSYSENAEPPLTSLDVPKQYMGRVVATRIVDRIENPYDHHPIKFEINTHVIIRKSIK